MNTRYQSTAGAIETLTFDEIEDVAGGYTRSREGMMAVGIGVGSAIGVLGLAASLTNPIALLSGGGASYFFYRNYNSH